MLETVSLAAFMIGLFVCLLSGISIVYALMAGYLIFFGYGLVRGHSAAELLRMSGSGVRKVRNILITFGLIGMLTALWRAAGTIPAVVSYSSQLIRPSAFFMFVFLLNCLVSVLTGTSLGTAATMGVICMAISSATRMSPVITGLILVAELMAMQITPMVAAVPSEVPVRTDTRQLSRNTNIKNAEGLMSWDE